MHVRYGSFDFEPYECGLSIHIEAIRSPRGFAKTRKVQIEVVGEVVAADQYATKARLQTIYNALSNNYGDCGLIHDNGDVTSHFLYSNHIDNLTGNQVRILSWPQTIGGEYTTGRKFSFVVDAELIAAESNILEWEDSLLFRGNGGPLWEWRRNPQWGHYPHLVAPASMQVITHSGRSVGAFNRIDPPAPFFLPPFEANDQRLVEFTSGQRFPQGYFGFETRWKYVYTLPVADDTLRPISI